MVRGLRSCSNPARIETITSDARIVYVVFHLVILGHLDFPLRVLSDLVSFQCCSLLPLRYTAYSILVQCVCLLRSVAATTSSSLPTTVNRNVFTFLVYTPLVLAFSLSCCWWYHRFRFCGPRWFTCIRLSLTSYGVPFRFPGEVAFFMVIRFCGYPLVFVQYYCFECGRLHGDGWGIFSNPVFPVRLLLGECPTMGTSCHAVTCVALGLILGVIAFDMSSVIFVTWHVRALASFWRLRLHMLNMLFVVVIHLCLLQFVCFVHFS